MLSMVQVQNLAVRQSSSQSMGDDCRNRGRGPNTKSLTFSEGWIGSRAKKVKSDRGRGYKTALPPEIQELGKHCTVLNG